MRPYKGVVVGEIVVGGIQPKVRIGDGRARHVDRVNNLLEERRGASVRFNVENGGSGMREKKSRTYCLFNQRGSTNHMMNSQLT